MIDPPFGFSFSFYGLTHTSGAVVSNGDLQFTASPDRFNYSAALQNFRLLLEVYPGAFVKTLSLPRGAGDDGLRPSCA